MIMLEEFLLEHYIATMFFSIIVLLIVAETITTFSNRNRPYIKCNCKKGDKENV